MNCYEISIHYFIDFFFIFFGVKNVLGQNIDVDTIGLSQMSYAEIDSLVELLYKQGEYEEAIICTKYQLYQVETKLGKKDSVYAEYSNTLGVLYTEIKKYQEAEILITSALLTWESLLGKSNLKYAEAAYNLARFYERIKKFDLIIKKIVPLKEIIKKQFGKSHPDYARFLNCLATAYEETYDYENSIIFFEESIQIFKKIAGDNNRNTIIVQYFLARLYEKAHKFKLANVLFIKIQPSIKLLFGKTNPIYCDLLESLAHTYLHLDKSSLAEQLYLKSMSIRRTFPNQVNPSYATTLGSLANVYTKIEQYNQAEISYLHALSILRDTLKESLSSTYYINIQNDLAKLYLTTSNNKKAKILLLDVKQKYQNTPKTVYQSIEISNLLGSLYRKLGNYEEALDINREVVKMIKQTIGISNTNYALALNSLALSYFDIQQYEESELLFLESISIMNNIYAQDNPEYNSIISNLAELYDSMGKHAQIATLLIEEINHVQKRSGKIRRYAFLANQLGVLYTKKGFYDKADSLYTEALVIAEAIVGKKHPDYAQFLHNRAVVCTKKKQFLKAEKLYQQAIFINEQSFGTSHKDYIVSLGSLGMLYTEMGHYTKAKQLYLKVLDKEQKILKTNSSTHLNNLSISYYLNNQLDSAYHYCIRSLVVNSSSFVLNEQNLFSKIDTISFQHPIEITASLVNLLKITKSQCLQQKSNYLSQLKKHYETCKMAIRISHQIKNTFNDINNQANILRKTNKFVSFGLNAAFILEENPTDAFLFVEKNKTIFLIDALKGIRARTLGDLPNSLLLLELNFQEQRDRLISKKQTITTKQDSLQLLSIENNLNLQIQVFLLQLKNKYPKYHAYKYENVTATASEIQSLLDDKTLFLEYHVADSAIYLFSLTKQSIGIHKLEISKKKLQQKTTLLRQALSDYEFIRNQPKTAREQYTKTAHWFYKNLVAPALDSQENINQLIIVPDHCLNHIPFEVFLSQASDTLAKDYKNLNYLLNDYSISYNYSATLLKENINNTPKQTNYKLLACAGYYTHQDSSLMTLRKPYLVNQRNQFKQLKSAEQEVAYLQAGFEGHFLTAEKANERSFKAIAPNYGVIHLAMHGRSDTLRPILSSLVFTENRDSVEDNFLQAYEISRLDLQAQLVVLSACETGYGIFEQGEGVLSLARSFMYAGVPSLVVSLWSVDDQSTAFLMQFFYQHLAEGLPKDQALRQAKLDFLAQADARTMHPFFWASFIQLGHTKSITLDKKGASGTEVLLLMAFITLILSGIFYYQKKYFS